MGKTVSNILVFLHLFMIVSCTNESIRSEVINLNYFLAPSKSRTNTYKCTYPCRSMEMASTSKTVDDSIKVMQTIYFSDDIISKNPGMPSEEKGSYLLSISDNAIIRKDGLIEHIILKTPFLENTKWTIKGTSGVVNGQKPFTSLKYECHIQNSTTEKIFGEKRRVVATKCISNGSPMEIITTRYASGIGFLRRKSEFIDNDGIIINKSETVISNSILKPR